MKKKTKIIVSVVSLIVILLVVFGVIDYRRVKNNKTPIFTFKTKIYRDGGSTEYVGLGYKVVQCNTFSGDKSLYMGFYNISARKLCANKSASTGGKSVYAISDNLVSVKVNENSLTRIKATFTFTNHTLLTYDFGEPFEIEEQKNGAWYKLIPVNDDYAFNLPAYILKSKQSREKEYAWNYIYGELKNGTYRLITRVFKEGTQPITEADYIYISAEFTIKN